MPTKVGTGYFTLTDINDGVGGLSVVLSNSSHLVPTDGEGNGGDYTGASTTISVYSGTTDVSALYSFTATPSAGVTGSLSTRTYTVSALTAKSGYVDIVGTRTGHPTMGARFSLTQARAGSTAEVMGAIGVVSERVDATENEAYYSLKVQADGKVAGFGLTATPNGTAILFSAEQIGFTNGTDNVLPFTIRNGIVWMDKARVSTIEAGTIINVEDVNDPNSKRAQLGNTLIEGSLILGKPGQIQWKDLSADFRDRLVQTDPNATTTGGTRSLGFNPVADGTYYLASVSGTVGNGNNVIKSGGASTQMRLQITGGIPFAMNYQKITTAPTCRVQLLRKKVGGTAETIDNRIYTGTATNESAVGEPEEHSSDIGLDVSYVCPLPTAGSDYEYWFVVSSVGGSWAAIDSLNPTTGGSITCTVTEVIGSSGGVLVESLAYNGQQYFTSNDGATGRGASVVVGDLYVGNFAKMIANNAGQVFDNGSRVYSPNNTNIGTGASNYAVGNHTHAYAPLTGGGTSGTWGISVTGNATTATTLQTARTINGVSFNGSANITVADSTKLPLTGGTLTGNLTAPTFIGALSGNATTATTLQTARTIAISGAVTGTATSFNGGANITIAATALNASNLSAGTVPDARISGTYTGLTNLTGSGTVDFSKFLGNAADTVAAPSFSWTGDLDTGIYQPVADQIAITTGGVQRALFTTTGVSAVGTFSASGATTLSSTLAVTGAATFSSTVTATGEYHGTSANNYRIRYGNYGTFWRNDGSNLYLMVTASGDQSGSYNSLRPFSMNLASGALVFGNGMTSSGAASFSSTVSVTGAATFASTVTASGLMYAKSHGNGTTGAKVLTYDDFLPATPPTGLEGVITASWISAGAIKAKHLEVSSGAVAQGSNYYSVKINPLSNQPIHYAQVNSAGTTILKDIFYINADGDAYLSGKLSKNTVDIESIQDAARTQINPYYLGTSTGTKVENTTAASMASAATIALAAVTTINGVANISFKLAGSNFRSASTATTVKPVWTVQVYRGTTSGTLLNTFTFTGTEVAFREEEGFFTIDSNISCNGSLTDTGGAASQVYTLKVTMSSGYITSLYRTYFGVESPSFVTNELIGTTPATGSWKDKETGFMIKWGTITIGANTTASVTFPTAFATAIFSAMAESPQNHTAAEPAQVYAFSITGLSIVNGGDAQSIRWIAHGY